jgi:hypothetical protein
MRQVREQRSWRVVQRSTGASGALSTCGLALLVVASACATGESNDVGATFNPMTGGGSGGGAISDASSSGSGSGGGDDASASSSGSSGGGTSDDGGSADDGPTGTGDEAGDDAGEGGTGTYVGTSGFAYTPTNFSPGAYMPPSGATTDCNATYSSTSHTFTTGSCAGTAPTIEPSVAQVGGGPVADILVFSSLTIAAGSTLTLTGANPVILAVYGNAAIDGTINASASGTTPGPGGNGSSCVAAKAGTGGNNGASGGGGGGKAIAGGAGSCGGQNCNSPYTIAGGGVSSTVLTGGCAGGVGEGSFGTGGMPTTASGAGGGGVQIAASGSITGSGTITANGTDGGMGSTGQNGKGGGGGGSGGYVFLQGTQMIASSLTLAANGGAGGMATGAGGTAGTNNGTTQVAPGDAAPEHDINNDGGGGGGAYGYVVVSVE